MKQIIINVQASLQNTDDFRVSRELLLKMRNALRRVCKNVNVCAAILSVLERDKKRVSVVKNEFLKMCGLIPHSSFHGLTGDDFWETEAGGRHDCLLPA